MDNAMRYRLGVDIGGTFTDFTVSSDRGDVFLWKQDTTPHRPAEAVRDGLTAVAESLGLTPREFLARTDLFVHGTTIATNAVIQRTGARVGLLCTEGFRDVLYLRDGFKPDRFDVHLPHPREFVDRHLRLGVPERIDADGEIVVPLDEDAVRAVAARFRAADVESVAVAFLWSIVNPVHERRAAEILREELPGVHVVQSADVLPEIREWQRTSATVISAYILSGIADYLAELERMLAEVGLEREVQIMQINGGCASIAEILERPIYALHSGPAAAPAAAAFYARDLDDDADLMTVDMGGTSFDVCVVRDGRATMSRTMDVDQQPIGVAGVEVHSVGAGGGSIAWIDSGGVLRVGPRSAGARPGPVCYGMGGTEPTVTDANVVLGRLAPAAFLGGRRSLDRELAREAIRTRVAEPLGLSVEDAAAGIIRIVNANMTNAMRAVSIERGIDPRQLVLACGGGAGGLHATSLARELEMTRVLIPREAGTFCAFGMTVTDVRHDSVEAWRAVSSDADVSRLDAIYARLEEAARERPRAEGFADEQIRLERSVDARYLGQVHELTVPVPATDAFAAEHLRAIEETFHREHVRQFTYGRDDVPLDLLHWRLTAIGEMGAWRDQPSGTAPGAHAATPKETRPVNHDGVGEVATAIYDKDELAAGATLTGPAIIESATTTIVVGPGDELAVRADGSYVVEIAAARAGSNGHGA